MATPSLLKRRTVWIGVIIAFVVIVAFATRPDKPAPAQTPVEATAVEVVPVAAAPLEETVSAVGTVAALHDVVVSSETQGRVMKVAVKVGDRVRAGEPLIIVDDELKTVAVDQAKAQKLAAETNVRKAERDDQRAETLFKSGDIADVELEGNRLALHAAEAQLKSAEAGLRAAERQLADTRVKSPINGLVASRKVDLGEMVSPGREVANIVDVSALKVRLSIPEEQISLLRPGQTARLHADSQPGLSLAGSVYAVGAKTETPTGHTYPVEVVVGNKDAGALRVGMFARVDILTEAAPAALSINKECLVGDAAHPLVFVVEGGIARLRPVTLGLRSADRCQVTDGLKVGELVISFGQQNLKDGAPVRYK